MPIQDQYPNTPGFVSQIQDGGLQLPAATINLTDSVLLFGVATDGPSNTPVNITSLQQGEAIFGRTLGPTNFAGAGQLAKSLTRGMYEAFNAGCTNITLCRVGGTSAAATVPDSTPANQITLTYNYPGIKYNAMTYSVTVPSSGNNNTGNITITTLDNVAHVFTYNNSNVYGDLINEINYSSINVLASQNNNSANPSASITLTATASSAFTGGADGTQITDAVYSNALTAAYQQVENYAADVVVPLGAYLQPTYALDASGNPTILNTNNGDTVYFGQNLAQLVARMSVSTHSAIGVIAIAPLAIPSFTNVVRRGVQLPLNSYTFTYALGYTPAAGPFPGAGPGTTGGSVDIGYLLNIFAGPDVIVNNPWLGNYVIDGAPTYAGLITSLQPQNSATWETPSNVLGLAYTFGASPQDAILGAKMVLFQNANGDIRVAADNTYAASGSDYPKLSTLRITYASVEAVRTSCSGFIGMPATPSTLNAMGTAINSALGALKRQGAIIDYTYQIAATSAQQIAGTLAVTLALIPALEIRKVYVTTTLQPPGSQSVSGAGTTTTA